MRVQDDHIVTEISTTKNKQNHVLHMNNICRQESLRQKLINQNQDYHMNKIC